MTLKTSSVNIRPVLNFFTFSLKKQIPLTLLITAFSFLIIPGMLIRDVLSHFEWGSSPYDMDGDMFSAWTTFTLGAGAVLMFMLLLTNFGFLFSKKAGDVFHALPLTRNQMLLTRGLASFIGGLFNFSICFAAVSIVNFLPSVSGVPFVLVIKTFLLGILYLFALTVFSLLFVVCSGGYFDTLIAFAAVNLCPVFVAVMLFFVTEDSTVGLNVDYSYLIYTTPIAYIFFKYAFMGYVYTHPHLVAPMERTTVWTVLAVVLLAVLCIIATVKLFKVRKSETAGEAYSFRFVPFVIIVLVSMVGGFFIAEVLSGFSSNLDILFWMFFIVGALLCSVAAGAIITRGFKTVKASFLKGAVAVVLMIALVITTVFVGSAAESRVPEAEQIKKIYLNYDKSVEFTDNFDIVLDLHKGITENIKNDKTGGETSAFLNNINDIRITYVLNDSVEIKRDYWQGRPNMDNLYPQLLALMKSEEYLNQFDRCFIPYDGAVEVRHMGEKYGYTDVKYEDGMAAFSEEQARKFFEIYKTELMDADIGVFEEECYSFLFSGHDSQQFFIPESFKQTVEYLKAFMIPEDEYYKSLGK